MNVLDMFLNFINIIMSEIEYINYIDGQKVKLCGCMDLMFTKIFYATNKNSCNNF